MENNIKLSNWYQFPQEFKTLISAQSHKPAKYKSVPFKNDLKFFNSTFVKKISTELLIDIYFSGLKLNYSKEEINTLEKYCDKHKYSSLVAIFNELWDMKLKKEFQEYCSNNIDTITYLKKQKEDSEDPFFNTKNFKFKKIDNSDKTKFGNKTQNIEIYCNDLLICEWYQGWDLYCSIDSRGIRSNLRNQSKQAKTLKWNIVNLKILMNNFELSKSINKIGPFQDDYPDLEWGYTGPSCPTIKEILEKFKQAYIPMQV